MTAPVQGMALDALLAQTRQNVAAAAPVQPAATPAAQPPTNALAGLLQPAAAASAQHAAAALAASVSNPHERGLPAGVDLQGQPATTAAAAPATLAAELAAPKDPTFAPTLTGDAERKITTLYVDCYPEGQHVVHASDIVREAIAELAAGGMQHWRCVDFGKGQGLLSLAVARRIRNADRVVLWTASDAERACLDAFIAQADNIVRGRS